MRQLDLKTIQTTHVQIINPGNLKNEPINITATHNVATNGSFDCTCTSRVEIVLEKETHTETKSMYICIEIQADFELLDNSLSRDTLHYVAVENTFPFLRATVMSIMSACGFQPIILSSDIIGN
ncbi:MAG: hypothetical protein ACI4TK_14320 [Agathobacter sp.]